MAMNIVGTPWKAVMRSALMQASDAFGEKYGSARVAPCVIDAVIASTMPKQWNIGTCIIMRSAVRKIHAVADALSVVHYVVVRKA